MARNSGAYKFEKRRKELEKKKKKEEKKAARQSRRDGDHGMTDAEGGSIEGNEDKVNAED